MKQISSNINIIGGGLIGAITAYSLSKFDLEISILEKKSIYSKKNFDDERTTAVSEGTKNFLDKIKIWKDIKPYCEPIKKISVIDRKLSNKLSFDNNRRRSCLGYIVKNKHFLNVIYSKLKNIKNVKVFNDVTFKDFNFDKEKIITNSNNIRVFSDLNIAADGKKSHVKNYFKTPFYYKNYNKKALVLTFTHSKNHNSTAFEFFYKNGPLAILPMKKNKNNFCSSLVWTNNNETVNDLMKVDNKTLGLILDKETQNSVGEIIKIISKQAFPLSAHVNSKFFEKRTLYIGDAAHSFHPIAGQGWNLGMNDVENLFNLVNEYYSLGFELGGSLFCKRYNDDNFYNAFQLYQITDKLDIIFQIQSPLFNAGRSSVINLIDKSKSIKNIISDFAMGIN